MNHTRHSMRHFALHTTWIAVFIFTLIPDAPPARPTNTITVNSILDTTGDPSSCTLRDAINAANTNAVAGGCAAGSKAEVDTHRIHYEEIALFELGADNDPCGPKHVEEELVGREAGSRPDEQQHEQVERMTHVAIGTMSREGRGGRGGSVQGRLERKRPERVKPAKREDPPGEAGGGEHGDGGREPTSGSLKAEEEISGRLPNKDEREEANARGDGVEGRVVGARDSLREALFGAAPDHAAVLDEEGEAEDSVESKARSV